MNHFWSNVFEGFKERRLASMFLGALAAFFGVLVGGLLLYQIADNFNLLPYWPYALTGIGLLLLAFIWRGFRQYRSGRLDRYKSSPLSRDEKAKARSKLITKPTFKSQ